MSEIISLAYRAVWEAVPDAKYTTIDHIVHVKRIYDAKHRIESNIEKKRQKQTMMLR